MSQMLCHNIEFQFGCLVYDLSPALSQLWQKRLFLQESLFSCHRGRAAPDTLNDSPPGALSPISGKSARALSPIFGKSARALSPIFGKSARALSKKVRGQDALL